jgi:hypothetical protein
LQTDPNNCGACGVVCGGGLCMTGGVCECPLGDLLCGGTCVPNSETNCGGCGITCGLESVCVVPSDGGTPACVFEPCPGAQCACNAFLAANESTVAPATTCDATEVIAYQVDNTGNCLDCLLNTRPCIDTNAASNLDCEDGFTGAGETAVQCDNVLACELGVTPAAVPAPITNSATTTPLVAYCGSTAFPACEGGSTAPNGGCIAPILAGFPAGFSPSSIAGNIASGPYPSSRAGKIVTCAINNCPQCVGGSTN